MYKLNDPIATRPFRLDVKDNPLLTRNVVDALFRGQTKLDFPIAMSAYSGGQATDFLWTNFPPLLCISDRVVTLLRENGNSGWSTFRVEVRDRKGSLLPGYHGFSVTGPVCKRDRSRSEIITKPPPTPTGKPYQVYRGLYFDESQWDGSDIFLIYAFRIIVSNKVQVLFKKNKITNVQLIPLSEVELPTSIDKVET